MTARSVSWFARSFAVNMCPRSAARAISASLRSAASKGPSASDQKSVIESVIATSSLNKPYACACLSPLSTFSGWRISSALGSGPGSTA